MTNYITQVARANGLATKVIAEANGVSLSFIKGKDGRPLEVSRSTNYPVYYPGALYVRKDAYAGVIRQVSAILAQRPKSQLVGFRSPELTAECGNESDNARCPGCTKGLLDNSSCFDSCPLFPKED
jgi:hypothetical protein